jgi:hypothetical protein
MKDERMRRQRTCQGWLLGNDHRRLSMMTLAAFLLLHARSGLAQGTVDKGCPPAKTFMVVWRGQVWQQEARSSITGELAAITLTFLGPLSGATVRVRHGPGPSNKPVLFEVPIRLADAGLQSVRIDTLSAHLTLQQGDLVVIEVEGTEASESAPQGALVGAQRAPSCSEPFFQNGTSDGVSPSAQVALTTHVCQGACVAESGTSPLVVTLLSDRPVLADEASARQGTHREPPPNPPPRHMDESWSNSGRSTQTQVVALHAGVEAQAYDVRVSGSPSGLGGAGVVRGMAVAYDGALTYRVLGAGALGGMTTGFSSRLEGDATAGASLRFGEIGRLFARAGMNIESYGDDKLDVSVFTLPSVAMGISLVTRSAVFELGPRGGAALRAAYAFENEERGQTYERPRHVAPSWGGSSLVAGPFGYIEGAVDRVEETNGLWLARTSACASLSSKEPAWFLCAWGKHLRGAVMGPTGVKDAPFYSGGLGLGLGEHFVTGER